MQKITPFLWYDSQAEEAAKFYVSIFKNSKITAVTHYGETGPGANGSVMTVKFELNGVEFVALNAGPTFKFTEAVSFVVNCETQDEIDYFWEKLSAGGETSQCGWLKDKFGLSWQVVPAGLTDFLDENDPAKSDRVMKAIMGMTKLDLATLKQAAENK